MYNKGYLRTSKDIRKEDQGYGHKKYENIVYLMNILSEILGVRVHRFLTFTGIRHQIFGILEQ